MRVTVIVDGAEAGEDARHLYWWLCDADRLRYEARFELTSQDPEDDPSAMGTVLDVVGIVLASGFSAAGLAATLAMWRTGRPRAGAATLTVGTTTVTIEDGSPETIRAIVDALTTTAGAAAGALAGSSAGASAASTAGTDAASDPTAASPASTAADGASEGAA